MEWNPAYTWLVLALLLSMAELGSGAMLLLALGVAAGLTALVAGLGLELTWQLLSMGVFSGVLVPVGIWYIRPRFSPRGVAYGTTGTGVEKNNHYTTVKRDFDGATGIKVNGDFYRLRVLESNETELAAGVDVVFKRFEGTTALVTRSPEPQPSPVEPTEYKEP